MVINNVSVSQPVLATIVVEPMAMADVPAAVELWEAQYREARQRCPALPASWESDRMPLTAFITERVNAGRGLIARTESQIAGFLLYDTFSFHGESLALSPMLGHAATVAHRQAIYTRLYEQAAARWVDEGILLHFVMYSAGDLLIQQLLFQLGFGVYVVGAFRSVAPLPALRQPVEGTILRAGTEHVDDILRLDDASRDYFRCSPRFLASTRRQADDIRRMLTGDTGACFLALRDQKAVGILHVRRTGADYGDLINMVDRNTGVLEFAYLQPACRGQGLGRELLRHALAWSVEQRLHSLHVDYESANLAAASFWPKEFTPVRCSVRRRVNEDMRQSKGIKS